MAVADHSIDPRILESARKEFVKHGFEKSSLKAICDGAGVTRGLAQAGASGVRIARVISRRLQDEA